jgi:hypothetical protein
VEQSLVSDLELKSHLIKEMEQKYSSQKEEVEEKTKKIKQFWGRLKSLENENKELDEMYLEEIQ